MDAVAKSFSQGDAPVDVEDGRIVHIGLVLLVEAVAQVILGGRVACDFQGALELTDAVLALGDVTIALSDGLVEAAVGLFQVDGSGCQCHEGAQGEQHYRDDG